MTLANARPSIPKEAMRTRIALGRSTRTSNLPGNKGKL
jgi:hypothetical protein